MKPQLYLAPSGIFDIAFEGVFIGTIRLKEAAIEVNIELEDVHFEVAVRDGITALFRLPQAEGV